MNTSTALNLDSRATFPWAPKLVKALQRIETHTPDDVLDALNRGAMQLWHKNDSIVVTEVAVYPRLKACRVFLAAGDFDDVWDLMDNQVEPWARNHGCKRIEGHGRLGWKKSAEQRGYVTLNLVMKKELKP